MASITQILPSELLSRTFSFLQNRRDVSSCRLVSIAFNELSSPFLITRVVFALRLHTISRLRDVIQHPYFSRYVTDLIYDGSRYHGDLATNWNGYVSRCEDAPRSLNDDEWIERKQSDAETLEALNTLEADGTPGSPSSGSELDQGEFDMIGMGRYYEQVYRMGCQRTFPDYYMRYKAQPALEQNGVHMRLLRETFRQLPKLRNITFTDYRGLATGSESYDACCRRLFGLTLEPDHIGRWRGAWKDVFKIFNAAAEVPGARIESFRIGTHPFESLRPILNCALMSAEAPELFPLDLLTRIDENTLSQFQGSFSKLHTLRFAYHDSLETRESNYSRRNPRAGNQILSQLLDAASANLEHLALVRAVDRTDPESDPESSGDSTYNYDFLAIHFPRLQYVEFRHLQLSTVQPLQDFLSRHAHTLREVRLIECVRADKDERLVKWASDHLNLTGAEIVHESDLKALTTTSWNRTRLSVKTRSDAAAENTLNAIEQRERSWICDRPNSLRRSVDVADRSRRGQDAEKWYLQPGRMS